MQSAQEDGLKPAPYAQRLGAVLIDMSCALPIFYYAKCSQQFGCVLMGGVGAYLLASLIAFLVLRAIPEVVTGRSLGKTFYGLRVRSQSGNQLQWGQSVIRQAAWIFPSALIVDALLILGTRYRQRISDMVARTVVVSDPAVQRSSMDMVVLQALSFCIVILLALWSYQALL